MRNDPLRLEVHAAEEFGVHPEQTGSPWQAAISSFVSFAVGAVIPLLPWFFMHGTAAVVTSIVLGAISAIGIGWTVAVFTGRSRPRAALRQLGIATLAAGVTFGVGSLVGVHTAL